MSTANFLMLFIPFAIATTCVAVWGIMLSRREPIPQAPFGGPTVPPRQGGAPSAEGCHVAYCYYYATGEGVTVSIAIGGSARHAESLFKERAHEFFHPGMVVIPLDGSAAPEQEDAKYVLGLIPGPVLDQMRKNPPGSTEYFSELHYNLT